MGITIFFIIIALLAIIAISRSKELSKGVKWSVITLFIIAIALASLYEYLIESSQKKIEPIILDFKNGKTLICEGKKVDKREYLYESGTSSLFPKEGVVGKTYSISRCKTLP